MSLRQRITGKMPGASEGDREALQKADAQACPKPVLASVVGPAAGGSDAAELTGDMIDANTAQTQVEEKQQQLEQAKTEGLAPEFVQEAVEQLREAEQALDR